jgi:hypothetical protein
LTLKSGPLSLLNPAQPATSPPSPARAKEVRGEHSHVGFAVCLRSFDLGGWARAGLDVTTGCGALLSDCPAERNTPPSTFALFHIRRAPRPQPQLPHQARLGRVSPPPAAHSGLRGERRKSSRRPSNGRTAMKQNHVRGAETGQDMSRHSRSGAPDADLDPASTTGGAARSSQTRSQQLDWPSWRPQIVRVPTSRATGQKSAEIQTPSRRPSLGGGELRAAEPGKHQAKEG